MESGRWVGDPPEGKPLQWGHGGNAVESDCDGRIRACLPGFNGATAGMPWKVDTLIFSKGRDPVLQWGHGGNAVERFIRFAQVESTPKLQWGHGGNAVESLHFEVKRVERLKLQWGHGGNAVESSERAIQCRGICCFNGATAGMPWKVPGKVADCACRQRASMGPRRECRGKKGRGGRPSVWLYRFNGATAGMPWKVSSALSFPAPSPGFNGATAGMPWKELAEFSHSRQEIGSLFREARADWGISGFRVRDFPGE